MDTKKNIKAMPKRDRDRIETVLKDTIKLRQKQLASIQDGVVEPLKENMELARGVLKGEDTIEHFLFNNARLHIRLEKLFRMDGD
ncbi:MAG: hypothetical protein PVI03_02035 [Candidatus Thorarchaeota archaeon]|jgi:hypothetical protein